MTTTTTTPTTPRGHALRLRRAEAKTTKVRAERDKALVEFVGDYKDITFAAQSFGVTRQTVYDVLERTK